jgi:hypothetical protein
MHLLVVRESKRGGLIVDLPSDLIRDLIIIARNRGVRGSYSKKRRVLKKVVNKEFTRTILEYINDNR